MIQMVCKMKLESLRHLKNTLDELKLDLKVNKFNEIKKEELQKYNYESFFDSLMYILEKDLSNVKNVKLKEFISNAKMISGANSISDYHTSFEEFYAILKYDFDKIYEIIQNLLII